jgi:uncharacterized OsmC-like protein
MEGVLLKRFKIIGTANMDLTTALGISEVDALKSLEMELLIESETDMEKLLEINELAKKRCPGYYCLSHEIIPDVEIKKE